MDTENERTTSEGFGSDKNDNEKTAERTESVSSRDSSDSSSRDHDRSSSNNSSDNEKESFSSEVSSFESSTGSKVERDQKYDYSDLADESSYSDISSNVVDPKEEEKRRREEYAAARKRSQEAILAGKEPDPKDKEILAAAESERVNSPDTFYGKATGALVDFAMPNAPESYRDELKEMIRTGNMGPKETEESKAKRDELLDKLRSGEESKAETKTEPKAEKTTAAELTTPTTPTAVETPKAETTPTTEATADPSDEEIERNIESFVDNGISDEEIENIITEAEKKGPYDPSRDKERRSDNVKDVINSAVDRIQEDYRENGFSSAVKTAIDEFKSASERIKRAMAEGNGEGAREAIDVYYKAMNTLVPGFENIVNGVTIAVTLIERIFGIKGIDPTIIRHPKEGYGNKSDVIKTAQDLSTKSATGKYGVHSASGDWNKGLTAVSDEDCKKFIRTMVRGQPHVRNLANKLKK